MHIRIITFLSLSISLLMSQSVAISSTLPSVEVMHDGKKIRVERTGNPNAYLSNTFALTSRPSPPFFIQPFSIDPKIETYGELEVLDFISHKRGVFIDARLKNWYLQSAIPSAINIPFKIFLSDSDQRTKVLKNLGGIYAKNNWDFTKAKTILFYCNGAWCGQSPTAIHALIGLGYPKEKMKYYRGGMQAWQLLGLTTIVPKDKK